MFGSSGLLVDDIYHEIRNLTGIEVDNRKQRIIKCIASIDREFYKYIDFFKGLPGFDNINIEDRVSLTKGTIINFFNLWINVHY